MIFQIFQISVKKRKRKSFIAGVVVTLCVLCIIYSCVMSNSYDIIVRTYEDISCHYSYENDSLPTPAPSFRPLPKSVYFHETSCKGYLNSRQACSVESTARSNPNWNIYVLFCSPVTKGSLSLPAMKVLQAISNVKFFRIHLTDYAKGTPVESLVVDGVLNSSWYRISHTSDVLRYLTLYKWGGVYMDLDVIVVKSFDTLENNWAARENSRAVAAGAMAFSRDKVGRTIAEAAIRDLASNFKGYDWSNNGPGVITRVLWKQCSKKGAIKWDRSTCNGFEVYGPDQFYPINWVNATDLFDYTDVQPDVNVTYSYHFWNKVTHKHNMTENSLYVKLAKRYCPSIYEAYGDSFGS